MVDCAEEEDLGFGGHWLGCCWRGGVGVEWILSAMGEEIDGRIITSSQCG